MSRRLMALALVLAVSAGLVAWTASVRIESRQERIVEVTREPFLRQVSAVGEVRSADSVVIGCPAIPRMWNFSIARLVPEGQEVQAGVPLVGFDTKKIQEELQVKGSELNTTVKELERTRLEEQEKLESLLLEHAEIEARKSRSERKLAVPEDLLQRLELEKLRLDDGLARDELQLQGLRIAAQRENMASRIRAAENRVARIERRVQLLGANMEKMTVRAPRAGFVVYIADWNGEKPKLGDSVWFGRSILEVADLSRMQVQAQVAEPDTAFVEVGQTVEIRLDANPDRLFVGRIDRLGRLFHTKSAEIPSIVFDAQISIAEADPTLMKPGMAAKLNIRSVSADALLQIPEAALRYTSDGPTVERRTADGKREMVAVKLGPRWEGRVVVEHGLEDGDSVRVEGGDS